MLMCISTPEIELQRKHIVSGSLLNTAAGFRICEYCSSLEHNKLYLQYSSYSEIYLRAASQGALKLTLLKDCRLILGLYYNSCTKPFLLAFCSANL